MGSMGNMVQIGYLTVGLAVVQLMYKKTAIFKGNSIIRNVVMVGYVGVPSYYMSKLF